MSSSPEWFEQLYRAAGSGDAEVPWDRPTANPLLAPWLDREAPPTSARTVVVGAGFGRDAELLASRGYAVTAFDVSPSAVAQARERHPDSPVTYAVGDLLDLPADWFGAYDLVVESMNVQALPEPVRRAAVRGVSRLLAPGGTLLVIAFGADVEAVDTTGPDGPPWPLSRADLAAFAEEEDVDVVAVEALDTDVLRWRATYRRRPEAAGEPPREE